MCPLQRKSPRDSPDLHELQNSGMLRKFKQGVAVSVALEEA
jgi:hypothetical protein